MNRYTLKVRVPSLATKSRCEIMAPSKETTLTTFWQNITKFRNWYLNYYHYPLPWITNENLSVFGPFSKLLLSSIDYTYNPLKNIMNTYSNQSKKFLVSVADMAAPSLIVKATSSIDALTEYFLNIATIRAAFEQDNGYPMDYITGNDVTVTEILPSSVFEVDVEVISTIRGEVTVQASTVEEARRKVNNHVTNVNNYITNRSGPTRSVKVIGTPFRSTSKTASIK